MTVRPSNESERTAVMDLFHRDFGTTRVSAFDAEHALVDLAYSWWRWSRTTSWPERWRIA